MTQNYILAHDLARKNAVLAVQEAPQGHVVSIKAPTRSLMQNNRLWALLTDICRQFDCYGRKLSPENWYVVFTAAL